MYKGRRQPGSGYFGDFQHITGDVKKVFGTSALPAVAFFQKACGIPKGGALWPHGLHANP